MDGLGAAVKEVAALVKQTSQPTVLNVAMPAGAVYVAMNGEIKKLELDPPHFNGVADTLETVAALAAVHKELCEIWYGTAAVVLVIDGQNVNTLADGYKKATLRLESSQAMDLLGTFTGGKNVNQLELVRHLRTTLNGRCESPTDLLERVRKVSFAMTKEATAENRQGRVSLGKSITAQLNMPPDAQIAETISFRVPLFDNLHGPEFRASVLCDFDINPEKEYFTITPLPGELDKAEKIGMEAIRSKLTELLTNLGASKVPLYQGEPKS